MITSQYDWRFLLLVCITGISIVLNYISFKREHKYKHMLDEIKHQRSLDNAENALANKNTSPITTTRHQRSAK